VGDGGLREEVEFAPGATQEFDGARRRRDRPALKTAGAGLVVQALSCAVRIAVIPLSLMLLGTERYGL